MSGDYTHSPAEAVKENIKDPTCTEDGSYDSVIYCSKCNAEISRETVTTEKLGHDYKVTKEAKEPTCTENGYSEEQICSRCNDKIGGDTIKATGHSPKSAVVENYIDATCTANGSYDSVTYCSVCNAEISRETISTEALGHDYKVTKEAKAPTCTEDGYSEERTCSRCGDVVESKSISATGHTAGSSVTENKIEATCTSNGSHDTVTYCTTCGAEINRITTTINKFGHDYKVTKEAKSPTCTENGYTEEKTCSSCGNVINSTTISANGHTTSSAVTENKVSATCTSTGSYDSVVYCSDCGAELSRTSKTIAKTGHSYTTKIVSATYQAKGYTLHTCKTCGTSYKDTYTNLKILTAPKLTVSNISSGVKLSWNKISGATGYVIYRDNKVIKTIPSSSTITFTDTSVKTKNGTKYYYKIMAYAGSTSVNKSALTGKTIYLLTTLSISKAYNSASKAISVYWTKNSSATGYQVQYSLSSDFTSSASKWVTKNSTLSTKITGLTKGKYYYVRVRSYKIVGGVKYYSGWRTYSTKIKISK